MTTEVWVTNFPKETVELIPDGKRLSSAQKSKLINNLQKYCPPSPRRYDPQLSPNHFGKIIDKGNKTTSISVPGKVEIRSPSNQNKIRFRTLNNPEIISNNGEMASISLPGYGNNRPISIQNISQ